MKGNLIKNELKLALSRKNKFAVLVLIVLMFTIYFADFIPAYNSFYERRAEELNRSAVTIKTTKLSHISLAKEANVNISLIREKMDRFDGERKEQALQEIAELEQVVEVNMFVADIHEQIYQKVVRQAMYHEEHEENEGRIVKLWEHIDKLINDTIMYEFRVNNVQFLNASGCVDNGREWRARVALREAYADAGLEQQANDEYPYATKIFGKLLDGTSLYTVVCICLFVVVMNFDIWANDFENESIKILFTIPFGRAQIYFTRIFVRLGITLLGIAIAVLLPSVYSAIVYGAGINEFTMAVDSLINEFVFVMNHEDRLGIAIAIPQVQYNLYLIIIQLLYVCMVFSVINIFSILLRNNAGVLIVGVIIIFFIFSSTPFSDFNPFSYYNAEHMLYGRTVGTGGDASFLYPIYGFRTYALAVLGAVVAVNGVVEVIFSKIRA